MSIETINPNDVPGGNPEWENNNSDEAWMAKQAREIQKDFGNRIKSLAESKEKMSQKEFERWEEEYSEQYNTADERLHEKGVRYDKYCEAMVNAVAYPGSGREDDLKDTIEAYAGNYYHERRLELMKAIDASGKTEEEKEKDRLAPDLFIEAVYRHIQFKYATREDQERKGYERFDRERTGCHNDTLKRLNDLNDLAREYEVKPFTARNFNPSDTVEKKFQTMDESTIFRYDRDIVEEYYSIILPDDVEKARRRLEEDMRFR